MVRRCRSSAALDRSGSPGGDDSGRASSPAPRRLHRPLDTPNVYYQNHLACPEWDAIGLSFAGVPGLPHFGHNAHVEEPAAVVDLARRFA